MGDLLSYFKRLKHGDALDENIVKVVLEKTDKMVGRSIIKDQINDEWTEEAFFIPNYYSWFIPYREHKINFHAIQNGQDALSCAFSGCAMALFYSPTKLEKYVAHICLLGENIQGDCRKVWIEYCENNNNSCLNAIFCPKAILDRLDKDPYIDKWGLISDKKEMYDITVHYEYKGNQINKIIFYKMKLSKPSFHGSKSKYLPISETEYYYYRPSEWGFPPFKGMLHI